VYCGIRCEKGKIPDSGIFDDIINNYGKFSRDASGIFNGPSLDFLDVVAASLFPSSHVHQKILSVAPLVADASADS